MVIELTRGIPQLQKVATAAATGSLDDVYQETMNTLKLILGAEVASLQLLDDNAKLTFVRTLLPEELPKLQGLGPIPIDEKSVSGYVVKTGEPLLLPDSWQDPRFGQRQRRIAERIVEEEKVGNRSYICVPIRTRGRTLGVLNILHPEPNWFTQEDKDLAVSIASYIAMAVAHAQFLERLTRVATAVSVTDLDRVYRESTNALRLVLGAEIGSIQVVAHNGRELEFVAALLPEELPKLQGLGPVPIDEKSVSGYVVKTGEPLLLPDSWQDPRFGQRQRRIAEEEKVGNRSYICVPILAREKRLGVLNILHHEPNCFSKDDLRVAVILASLIGAGVQNARQVREILNVERAAAMADAANNFVHTINNNVGLIQTQVAQLERRRDRERLNDEYLWSKLSAIKNIAADTINLVARFKELDQFQRVNPIDTKSCIAEAVQRLDLFLVLNDTEVRIALPDDAPRVYATEQLIDVFENLIRNSIEAMRDSFERKVYVFLKETAHDYMRVSISDTGPGIPPVIKDRLFQFGVTTKASREGGGYGLWWVKTWLRRIGGDIRYDEVYEGGARFIVDLPLRPPKNVLNEVTQ